MTGVTDKADGQRLSGEGMHRRMNQLTRRRWIFSPITSWQARRLSRMTGIDHDAAWVKLRTTTHPEEAVYTRRLPGEQDASDR